MIEIPSANRIPFLRLAAAALLAALVLAALLLGVGALRGSRARAAVAFWSVCPAGCDYATIQGAVDAAGDGDVIRVVGSNTYVENVVITKSLTLRGGCSNAACDQQAPHLLVTTIDGGGAGRVVTVRGDPVPITVTLDGFTITGGNADSETDKRGGGVGSWDAHLILTRDVVTDNVAARSYVAEGGGIYVYSGTFSIASTAVLSNQAAFDFSSYGGGIYLESTTGSLMDSRLQGNLASSGAPGSGGGLAAESCSVLTFTGNVIYSNTAALVGNGSGGGLFLRWDESVVMDDNTIVHNLASRDGAGNGGGAWFFDGAADLNNNHVVSNTGSLDGTGQGGGLRFSDVTATLAGDAILANVATFSSTAYHDGDGVYCSRGVLTVANGVVARNGVAGSGSGEGLYLVGGTGPLTAVVVNSTVVSNATAGVRCAGAQMTGTLVNLIAWGNGDDLDCSGVPLAYSDVEDAGDTGPGVIHQDPLFVDAANDDYHLQANSPCIDAGAAPITYTFVPADDWDGDRRPVGNGYDVGADEVLLAVYLPLVLREY